MDAHILLIIRALLPNSVEVSFKTTCMINKHLLTLLVMHQVFKTVWMCPFIILHL